MYNSKNHFFFFCKKIFSIFSTNRYCTTRKIMSNTSKAENVRFIWMDLEMTGLNPETDNVLEIACLVTDNNLVHFDEGIVLVIHQPDSVLSSMNDWCLINHEKSGLIRDCKKSTIIVKEAEAQIFNYIQNHTNKTCTNYLAGNSIYMDLLFIKKFFPSFTNLFHYRLLDVSTLKILCSQWKPKEFENYQKKLNHRALQDIHSSIDELKFYKNLIF